ncbi:MAG: NAD(P)-dependent glycerol-3-phosphate dehydrogenase [Clostridiales Family XIII bacterium]|jgi:glycerol-3-phosphate dehydrogenase (NAD(P)+)|nr:NAD(P)-dependent glycerol-3-phosphate dehydrogenase [Clostridiales Family XIII bacterium]
MSNARIGVVGAGSWGSALGNLLAEAGRDVRIWDIDQDVRADIRDNGRNSRYLPGVKLAAGLKTTPTDREAVSGADIALFAVPTQHFRAAVTSAARHMNESAILLNVAKGIDLKTLRTISRIAKEYAPGHTYAVLSGPSHAEEVALGMPTTVAAASDDADAASYIQEVFTTERFRVYTNPDVLGLELGGALKNIIALGAGISDGMGYGDNTKAALMTRGIAEMVRLGVSMGARAETFSGLAGVGDLIVTCTSMHSRNRRCGILIGEGMAPKAAVERIGMVVEGITTAEAAVKLAADKGVELPIAESVYRVIKGEITPGEALNTLMTRPSRDESYCSAN